MDNTKAKYELRQYIFSEGSIEYVGYRRTIDVKDVYAKADSHIPIRQIFQKRWSVITTLFPKFSKEISKFYA
jgi:hypothetical protein